MNDHWLVTKIPLTTSVFIHASVDGMKVILPLFTKNIALVFSMDPLIFRLGQSTITVNGSVMVVHDV